MSSSLTTMQTIATRLAIDPDSAGHPVSPRLFGMFFEDINFGLDGGLNANLVNNHSFEGVYLDRHLHNFLLGAVILHKKPRRLIDHTRHWSLRGGSLEARSDMAIAEHGHGHYARVTAAGEAVLRNDGYPGSRPGMGARDGVALLFRARIRAAAFTGALTARLVDGSGRVIAQADIDIDIAGDGAWATGTARLEPERTALVSLEIVLRGRGEVDLDEVSLVPADHWGAGDPRWSQGLLRRDLVEALAASNPTFLRFPGGCIIEGLAADNAYDWKKTIGPIEERRSDYSLWGLHRAEGDYHQSHQIGFYEFFLLCEDLGIDPIPVVSAGICCQNMARGVLEIGSPEFQRLTQDIYDLIDWATADADTNPWAALRAEAGHPEPFSLTTIGIGNENTGSEFYERFDLLRAAVEAYRPGIEVVMSGSPGHGGRKYAAAWAHAREVGPDLIVDEHFYASPKWFAASAHRYDDYDRSGPKVFVGEYAAQFPNITTPRHRRIPANTFRTAVAEAAFLTGVVRNSDIVEMSSYAPLLNMVEEGQWSQNFIDFNPFTVQPTVNAELQKFFTDRLGRRTVPLPHLPDGVLGSATRAGRELFVHLVNQNDHPVPVEVAVPGSVEVSASVLEADLDFRHDLGFDDTCSHELGTTPSEVRRTGITAAVALPAGSVTAFVVALDADDPADGAAEQPGD